MKLIINYDLLNKIKEEHNGISLKKNIVDEILIQPIYYTVLIGLNVVQLQDFKENLISNIVALSTCFLFGLTTRFIATKTFEDDLKKEANQDLVKLSKQLNEELNLNTNIELLKNSKISNTRYKITLNKNNIPKITQNKYILVPTYDNLGNIKDESLLQEHDVGSKIYQLSIGNYTKVTKTKLVYNI